MTPKHILMHNTRTKHQKEEQSRPREQVFTIKSECLASSTFLGSYSSLRQEKKKKKKLLVPKRAPRASSNTGAPTHTLKEEEDVYAGDSLLSHHHKSAEYT